MNSSLVRSVIVSLLLGSGASVTQAGENCTCRYDGKDVLEGASICMKTPNGLQMAECSRVLNNTAWKFTGQPCPYAGLDQSPVNRDFLEQPSKISG